jgi:uncharacterized protein YciW
MPKKIIRPPVGTFDADIGRRVAGELTALGLRCEALSKSPLLSSLAIRREAQSMRQRSHADQATLKQSRTFSFLRRILAALPLHRTSCLRYTHGLMDNYESLV